MCGILGYKALGNNLPVKDNLTEMLVKLEARGKDATGIAGKYKTTEIEYMKAPIPASEFVKMKLWKNMELPGVMILHARQATHGTKAKNENNHPIVRDGFALVHNGMISNDDDIFKRWKIERKAEVDSEALIALYAHRAKSSLRKRLETIYDNVRGSFAAAIISSHDDNIVLFRHLSPLDLVLDEDKDIIYFCSLAEYVTESIPSSRKFIRGLCIKPRLHVFPFEENHGCVIRSRGMDDYHEYKVKSYAPSCSNYYRSNYYSTDEYTRCPECRAITRYDTKASLHTCVWCQSTFTLKPDHERNLLVAGQSEFNYYS